MGQTDGRTYVQHHSIIRPQEGGQCNNNSDCFINDNKNIGAAERKQTLNQSDRENSSFCCSGFIICVGTLLRRHISKGLFARLRVEQLEGHGFGQRVDEQSNEENEQQNDEYFENEPLVVLPDDVLEGLERIHEPQERRVRATVHKTHHATISGGSSYKKLVAGCMLTSSYGPRTSLSISHEISQSHKATNHSTIISRKQNLRTKYREKFQ